MNETGNDSSSEDDDYKPSKKEIMEADADDRKQKRKVASDGERMLRQAKVWHYTFKQGLTALTKLGRSEGMFQGASNEENTW